MIELWDYSFGYSRRLISIDYFKFTKGIHYISGSSGSGKTSFLKCLDGRLPYNGLIKREGNVVSYYKGFVIPYNCSLRDMKKINKLDNKRYYELIVKFNLEDKEDSKMGCLSIGERQRAELIVCLSSSASIYLVDEPCSSLNDKFRRIVYNCLEKLGKNYCVIVVSHDYKDESLKIENGRLIGKCKYREGNIVNEVKPSFSVLLLYKLWFSKLKTFINLMCVILSIIVCYITFNIDKYLMKEDTSGIGENILVKIQPIIYNTRLLGIILMICTFIVYCIYSGFDLYIHRKELTIYSSASHNMCVYIVVKFIIEIVLILMISFIVIFLLGLILMK